MALGCITRFVGRLLFVTLLVSSAYLHISKPQEYQKSFAHGYEHMSQHFAGVYPLPAATVINWNLWIQIYGALQGLIALLVISGDRLGGWILFLSLVVSGSTKYCHIDQFLQWEIARQLEFAQFLSMVGASLILATSGSGKKSACKESGKCC